MYENKTGLNVAAQYGPRDTGTLVGVETRQDSQARLAVDLSYKDFVDSFNQQGASGTIWTPPVVVAPGFAIFNGYLLIKEPFKSNAANIAITFTGDTQTVTIPVLAADLKKVAGTVTPLTIPADISDGITQEMKVTVAYTDADGADEEGYATIVLDGLYK